MTIFQTACSIIETLTQNGYIAYFTGGWVRDFLMNTPSDDIDIATNAPVDVIAKLFFKTIPVGVQFGIIIVVLNNHQFEVAVFRKDQGYLDGRRPIGVETATPQEDALRRDFTINGMFYDPLNQTIYDFVEGQSDIQKKIVRAIGNPHERFLEDRLRMIRAVRYSTRFNFAIDYMTMEAITMHASKLFPAVAIERIWQEFQKMARFAHFDIGLISLHRLDLLPTIFPKLHGLPVEEIQSRLRHIPFFPANAPLIAKLIELFPDNTFEENMQLCDYLKLPNLDKNFVAFFHHAKEKLMETHDNFELAKLYADLRCDLCIDIIALKLSEKTRREFLSYHSQKKLDLADAIYRLRQKNPIVSSKHLLAEGIKPGKQMGILLKEAEKLSINEKILDPQALIMRLKKSPHWKPLE